MNLKQFTETNSKSGNMAVFTGNNPLDRLADEIAKENAIEYSKEPTDDISYFLARLQVFAKDLKENKPQATDLWRAMLCEIFLLGLFENDKVIRHEDNIYYYNNMWRITTKNNSTLTKMVQRELLAQKKLTFVEEAQEEFLFFAKKSIPFAMFIPGLVILPLKNLSRELAKHSVLLAGVEADRKLSEWRFDTVVRYFKKYPTQLPYFNIFLTRLYHALPGAYCVGFDALSSYLKDLNTAFSSVTVPMEWNREGNMENILLGGFKKILKEKCTAEQAMLLDTELSNENIFCFPRTEKQMDNEGYAIAQTTMGTYRFHYYGERLMPLEIPGYFQDGVYRDVFLVPPFTKELLGFINKNSVGFSHWDAKLTGEDSEIKVSIDLSLMGIAFNHQKIYSRDNTYIAQSMPYLCLWPYADIAWHEYLVGICCDYEKTTVEIKTEVHSMPGTHSVSMHQLKIGLSEAYEEFTGETIGIEKRKFSLLRAVSFPDAVFLSYQGIALGFWCINRDEAKKSRMKQSRKAVIGFDFATTSSVIKLYDGFSIYDVEGPGEYLYDIFNPLYGTYDKSCLWEDIHNYIFMGNEGSTLKKIYTYGQNFDTYRDNRQMKQTANMVTGRAVLVSPGYLKHAITSKKKNDTQIFGNLKWPNSTDSATEVTARDEARDNFILNVLSWGLLKAKILGFCDVDVHISYPRMQLGDSVLLSVMRLRDQLSKMSGIENIHVDSFREAEANASYLINGYSKMLHSFPMPNPENGYMVVDIGGGTTDVTVCRYTENDDSIPFSEKIKAETSFRFAGKELIDIPLLLTENFKSMWKETEAVDIDSILMDFSSYKSIDTRSDLHGTISRSISTVGFILDNSAVKSDYVLRSTLRARSSIKFKFLALFWLMGRYLYQLEKSGSLGKLDRVFRIYLTGCASNGIGGFCAVDDDSFIDKCNLAVQYGYSYAKDKRFHKNLQVTVLQADADKNSGVKIKDAVADGLLFLAPPEQEKSAKMDDLDSLEALAKKREEMVKPAEPDKSHIVEGFINLIDVLANVTGETLNFREMSGVLRTFVQNTLQDEKVLAYLAAKIGRDVITDDFIAMYLLEIYLDAGQSIQVTDKRKRGCLNGFSQGICQAKVRLPIVRPGDKSVIRVPISFRADYSIEYPDSFEFVYNGQTYTKRNVVILEPIYRTLVGKQLQAAVDKLELTYEQIPQKKEEIRDFVIHQLNHTVWNENGFNAVGLSLDILELNEEDSRIYQNSLMQSLCMISDAYYHKRKDACVTQGVITITRQFKILEQVPFVRNNNTRLQVGLGIQGQFKIVINDTDLYYTYRGINIHDGNAMQSETNRFASVVQLQIKSGINGVLSNGIRFSDFRIDDNTIAYAMKGYVIKGDVVTLKDAMLKKIHQINQELKKPIAEFSLRFDEMTISAEVIPDKEMWKALSEEFKENLLRKHGFGENTSVADCNKIIEELRPFQFDADVARRIAYVQNILKQKEHLERERQAAIEVYERAKKTAGNCKSIGNLKRAIILLNNATAYAPSAELKREYNAKLNALLKKQKKIRRLVIVLLILAFMVLIYMESQGYIDMMVSDSVLNRILLWVGTGLANSGVLPPG